MSLKQQQTIGDDSLAFPSDHNQALQLSVDHLNESPLYFALRINGKYYISFQKGKFWLIMLITAAWSLLNYFIYSVVSQYSNIGDTVKQIVKICLTLQIILQLIICLVDAGTIFQDEEDTYSQQRVYCTSCKLYRRKKTKHCIWCNRCTQYYDHHCSVFAKCIGKRNLVPFWLFVTITGIQTPSLIIITILNILGSL